MNKTLLIALLFALSTGSESMFANDPNDNKSVSPKVVHKVDAYVSVLDEIQLPARRNGVIEKMPHRKGDLVEKGQVVAVLNKVDAEAALRVREAELNAAKARATNDSQVKAAKSDLQVAITEYETLMRVRQSAVDLEIARVEGEMNSQKAQLESALADKQLAELESLVAEAKLKLATQDIKERTSNSPLTGIVSRVHANQGEWVQAGEPIASIVRLDVLLIESYLDVTQISPRKSIGSKVQFTLDEEELSFEGLIKNASPTVDADGKYQVWFEVRNRQDLGSDGKPHWVLRPGMAGTMSVEISKSK